MTKRLQQEYVSAYLAAIVWLCSLGTLSANPQEYDYTAGNVESKDVETTLESLLESTSTLRNQLDSDARTPADEWAQQPLPRRPVVLSQQTEVPAEMEEIRKRIELLKQLRSRHIETHPDSGAATQTSKPNEPNSFLPPALGSSPKKLAMNEIERSLENKHSSPRPPSKTAQVVSKIHSKRILSSPVNKMQLGESLYRTGNFVAALKAFETVDAKTLDKSEVAWRDLMLALCHRRTGDIGASESILRDLANAKGVDFSRSMARWWLKQTTMTEDVKPMISEINKEIETLIESAQRHANR